LKHSLEIALEHDLTRAALRAYTTSATGSIAATATTRRSISIGAASPSPARPEIACRVGA